MPRRILIADDGEINRQMLIHVLKKDYDIIEAENGKEALELIHRNYKMLSAVLLDVIMPEMNGYDVLGAVRSSALFSQIPVIMVTGSEDEVAREKALALGANDFIIKPFNPEIVRHCLRNCIALRETASILNAIQRDKLTGLYNRETFFDRVSTMLKEKEPGYYLLSCFDIDNFKLINDQYGAVEGDRILKEVGTAVKENMDAIGGIAGRISADNFAALIPVSKKDTDVLYRIQTKELVRVNQRSVAFSVGRYIITDFSLSPSALYDRAYLAKQSVKGRYDKHLAYFDDTMLQKLVNDQQISGSMEEALREKQFEIWFQPQYNHVAGTLVGSEALVRWRHPEKGIISPAEFIPLFEQNGFIYELDKYVWRETCRYQREWIDKGLSPLPVSVNVSRSDIFRADLLDVITGLMKEYQLPTELLRLEITESAFASSTHLIVDIVKKLIALGFVVEIDDFGSGYSSLNTLKSVPAQIVKLDMRFLESGEGSQRGGNIVESVVRMLKWLGMSVIAEGVETKEQADFLKSIGCTIVQGYLYARPMPVQDFEEHFKNAGKQEVLSVMKTVGHLNNDAFWNPESIDSLIFNSYVGAACVLECYENRVEVVRATDKYAKMFGGETLSLERILQLNYTDYLSKEASERLFSQIENSIETMEEFTDEYLFLDLPGCPHKTYIRSTMRVIANRDNRSLVYCISENITAQREAERQERRLIHQLRAIMDGVNCGITATMTAGGEHAGFLLANDKYYEILGYTKKQYDKEIGTDVFSTVFEEDRRHVLDTLDYLRRYEKASMEYRVICRDKKVIWLRSFLSLAAFEGVEGPVRLCTYADITAEKNTAQNLLDNLPCGAGICVVSEKDAHMVYLNKRYYTYFKHRTEHGTSASVFDLIHPDDRLLLRESLRPALAAGGEGSCLVRVLDGTEYIPFRIFGTSIASSENENEIYVTFIPIEHEEFSFSEMLPVALEQMMASSSDLSFVKDKNLRYLCCSRPFAKMIGLDDEKTIVGKTDFDIFGKELAQKYIADDKKLMKSGVPIVEMVEELPAENGKVHYSSTSKYLLYNSSGEVIGLYGTGRDITNTRDNAARQEFLINSIPGGVAVYEGLWTDLSSIHLAYFSDGFCNLFGYTRKEYEKLGEKNPMGLVEEAYLPGFKKQIEALVRTGTPIDYYYPARAKEKRIWIHIKAVMSERRGNYTSVNAVLFDVTEHQEMLEKLRVSEEENRLALKHSENVVCRYDVQSRSLRISGFVNSSFDMPAVLENVPYGEIERGAISPETANDYAKFYEDILDGSESGNVVYQRMSKKGWRWIEADSSTIFSDEGKPLSAVISFVDVTDHYEKEAVYKRWKQSLHTKAPETYSLFRCNVTKKTISDVVEGKLLRIRFAEGPFDFDDHAEQYVSEYVYEEDAAMFAAFLNVDVLLRKYLEGERVLALEYREKLPDGDYHWLRLTADLVEAANPKEVEVYLLFEDIDEAKRKEILTLERAQKDALTGVYNRTTFMEKTQELIASSGAGTQHALLMLDLDGFKSVNDAFGHEMGDRVIVEIAQLLGTSVRRREDLLGRLGGDEFVILLRDIPRERFVADKAKQICDLCRKSLSVEVQISGSLGIALYPQDGKSFDELYKKADQALYYVKGSGSDNFAFYHEDMSDEHLVLSPEEENGANPFTEKKRRILIVEDNKLDYELLANIFRESFIIERAKDGNSALIRLRHYGSAISVVLLDLMMPGMDGFAVLEKMQNSHDTHNIPVVVVSGVNDRETNLRAIRSGASDFVSKPVDADLLRIRVQSAISKAENEKLRAKNNFLEIRDAETMRYKTVLESIGVGVAEMDWGACSFVYSPNMADMLFGKYDARALLHIFLSDMVAEADIVRKIQQYVHDLAEDRNRSFGSLTAPLKGADGVVHPFLIRVYKIANEFGLTDKLILAFTKADQ